MWSKIFHREADTKVIKETDKETAMEHSISKMVDTTKDNGKMIKCMVLVNSITRTEL
jgi:hypothetical protein